MASLERKKMGRSTYMKKIYNSIARDVASSRNTNNRLEAKEKFLRSEILLHQAKLLAEEQDEMGVEISNISKLTLKPDQLETLGKQLDCHKKAACISFSRVTQELEKVEGLDEVLDLDRDPVGEFPLHSQDEKGLFKSMRVEGTVDQFNFKLECLVNHLMESRGGELVKVHQLDLNPLPDIIKKMLKSPEALEPSYVNRTLNNLHYLQMLEEERGKTANGLEDDIPDLIVKPQTEPLELEYFPTEEQSIKIYWGITFDAQNFRLRYEIIVRCSEDVMAYYSQNNDAFPYLHSKKTLKSCEDVVNFFDSFL